MNLSEPFIRRPVATTLLTIGFAIVGVVGYLSLPVSALPQVDYPTIVVSTSLPGASAETIASSVTTPLERQFGQMPSLDRMTSISTFGSSQITLQFRLERSIDAAEQDVQAAINAASSLLPRTLPTPPTYSKSNPADQPILTLAVSSRTLPLADVDDYADSVLGQKIAQVAGVGLVSLSGGQKPAVRVRADPLALAGAQLTLENVRQAIVAANVNQPTGNVEGTSQTWTLQTNDQLDRAASFRPIIVSVRDNSMLRLADVARVVDGVENEQLAGWVGTQRAVIVQVQRQPGANLLEVTDRVKALLPTLRASMPDGVDVSVVSDRTETVRASIADVQFTLVLTIVLLVIVIYSFLGSLRATIIPAAAVPLSLIGTFALMHAWGFSLNNLTLMALTIATGFVVDDAIVMLENVQRHVEEGVAPFEAALTGAKEIGFTIVSLTVSLVSVLIPLLFMGGLIGRLFREFAVTLALAVVVSAVLSLTLTATMCAWILKPIPEGSHEGEPRLFERAFTRLTHLYDRTLQVVLRHPRTTMLVTFATVVLTGALAVLVPKGFFPVEDTGLIIGMTEVGDDVAFERLGERQQALVAALMDDPDVDKIASSIGADAANPRPNGGRLSITLKPRETRRSTIEQTMARLRTKAASIAGLRADFQAVQDLTVDTRQARTAYQYTLESADPDELDRFVPLLVAELQKSPGLRNVSTDGGGRGPSLSVVVDRDTAARLGVSTQAIDDVLYDAFGQRQVSIVFTQLNQYRVILEVRPEDRFDPESIGRLYVPNASGDAVPLSMVARFETRSVPLSLVHQGQFPATTIGFDTRPGGSLEDSVAAIRRAVQTIGLPRGVRGDFEGTARAFEESAASEPLLILAALITVYIVLGVLYESYVHPITILSTLPSAGIGAFGALILARMDFTIVALIGVVLLIGIVKKNAIMMIDFALEAQRERGLSPLEAMHQACLLRFRPIMMTTMAALFGGIPLALGTGTGSELRRPLGITIVGGLILSQILTLYTTPIVYLVMDELARRFEQWRDQLFGRVPEETVP